MSHPTDTAATPRRATDVGGGWVERWGDIVIPVFLLGLLLPVRGIEFLVPAMSLPINTLACVGLVAVAVWAPSRWPAASPAVLLSATALVGWLVARTVLEQGLGELRRTVNILTLFLVAGVIASGRVHVRSLTRGIGIGLVAGLIIGVALLPRSSYVGRLTGVLGDPNAAGYVLATLGFAAAQSLTTRRTRLVLWAVVAVGIALTVSRTSMFAFAVATLWVWLAPRMRRLGSLALLGGTSALYLWLNGLAEARNWFTARDGSDTLREELAAVERRMVDQAGWWGDGLGTAVTEIRGTTLFFHNSYRAMQVEGGLIALGLLLLLLGALFWMVHQLPPQDRPVWAEGAIIAALICSFNIGFSLTSPPLAVAIGLYLAYHGAVRERSRGERPVRGLSASA
ncbi:hypothetical protein [Tessaracoccus lapidicaptus]|uniref:hypothetical protein n=1 Tax=Tessaracoccus lapidicaptus TaxID=1427523 RepID=UPI0033406749